MDLNSMLLESVNFINHRFSQQPKTAIVTGTGLNGIVQKGEMINSVPYSQIPHFPISTAPSHLGKLVLMKYGEKYTWVLAGRIHYYEGYSMATITYPIRVLELLGVSRVLITNASGGLNPRYNESDIVFIEDHISLLPDNPLRGFPDQKDRSRYVDLIDAYSPALLNTMETIATTHNIPYKKGIYVGVQGPSLETRAEYRFLRKAGADVVGMSSIPEVIVARHCGLEVGLISVVSNKGFPVGPAADLKKILDNVEKTVPDILKILTHVLV